jgi:hypothetical protein
MLRKGASSTFTERSARRLPLPEKAVDGIPDELGNILRFDLAEQPAGAGTDQHS